MIRCKVYVSLRRNNSYSKLLIRSTYCDSEFVQYQKELIDLLQPISLGIVLKLRVVSLLDSISLKLNFLKLY